MIVHYYFIIHTTVTEQRDAMELVSLDLRLQVIFAKAGGIPKLGTGKNNVAMAGKSNSCTTSQYSKEHTEENHIYITCCLPFKHSRSISKIYSILQ